ncbi:hypothetical protein ABDK56_02920 [Sphingomonas sp. ASV193]|uniref:tetratricopeptide repeat protein n=1 Tax=Sphingomonas sp. ASV193 TaxID=3144405 RepID=UPI0032E852CE
MIAAIVAVVLIAREMVLSLPADARPAEWIASWPASARLVGDQAMRRLGAGAASGQATSPATREAFARLARLDPLSPQPLLFDGALTLQAGKPKDAERQFAAAKALDPRSAAARYFLATVLLGQGQVGPALDELAMLKKVSVGGGNYDAAFAEYAKSSGNIPAIEAFLAKHPEHRAPMLAALASDPANAGLVLRLAGPIDPAAPPPDPDWRSTLLLGFVNRGQADAARLAWRQMVGAAAAGDGLYNPRFLSSTAPAPFNWTLTSGDDGLVEPDGTGKLNLVYYGRHDSLLAAQTTLLAPGRYRLSLDVAATTAHSAMAWSIQCQPGGQQLAQLSLDREGAGPVAIEFAVPAGCNAQRFDLRGMAGMTESTSEMTISNLSLVRLP